MDQWGHQQRRGWTAAPDDADADAPVMRVPKTAELVADHFRHQIIGGALVEGEHLPCEAALTDVLGIARPTLREALRILESEGLIAVTRGARTGAKVLRPGIKPVTHHAALLLRANRVTVADLFAARLAFEPDAIGLLCATGDRALLAKLHDRLAVARRALANGALHRAQLAMSGFALLLVKATGNNILAMFAQVLNRLLAAQHDHLAANVAASFAANLAKGKVGRADHRRQLLQSELRAGEQLLALIAAGECVAAMALWRDHLAAANAVWLALGAGEMVVELPPPR